MQSVEKIFIINICMQYPRQPASTGLPAGALYAEHLHISGKFNNYGTIADRISEFRAAF
jgi:hypothetical protein